MTGQSTTDAAILFEGAGKKFGDDWVLENLNVHVERGTIIGLIGPSGSGKTTTVRLANGHYRPDAGSVRTLGTDPTTMRRSQRTTIGYLPQQPVLFDELSLWENLNFHASLNGVRFRRSRRLRELLQLVDLEGEEKKLVRESSGGMQRRLALAATMVHDPVLLMLDEPTAGIDPILRRRFWEHFRQLSRHGTTLVVTTQFVSEAAHCDIVAMLAHGNIAALGTPAQLLERAFDGVVVDVDFEGRVNDDTANRLLALDGITRAIRTDDHRIRVSVDRTIIEPGALVRHVADTFGDAYEVAGVAEVAPDWDDVFIELVGADSSDDVNSAGPSGSSQVGVPV